VQYILKFIYRFLYCSLGLEQKNVIIQRDHYGYSLTVSGDNPVYILSVREGGAAHRAGINVNDQIIKVK
jgi:C-terminal processing protease CtpA/Prc